MDVSLNGGTQQPLVFLLKMIILGCFGGTPIFGNPLIFTYIWLRFLMVHVGSAAATHGGSGTGTMQLDEVNSILHYMSIKPYGVLGVGEKNGNNNNDDHRTGSNNDNNNENKFITETGHWFLVGWALSENSQHFFSDGRSPLVSVVS